MVTKVPISRVLREKGESPPSFFFYNWHINVVIGSGGSMRPTCLVFP